MGAGAPESVAPPTSPAAATLCSLLARGEALWASEPSVERT